jgi:hypothetical protein
MILPLFLISFPNFFLSLLGTGSALEANVGEEVHATGAVILVVDGMGAAYVCHEYRAYAQGGAATGKALVFNLNGERG